MGRYKGYRKYICKKIGSYIEDFMEICNGEKIMLFKSLDLYETPKAIESICHSYQIALEEEFVDPLILYHVLF